MIKKHLSVYFQIFYMSRLQYVLDLQYVQYVLLFARPVIKCLMNLYKAFFSVRDTYIKSGSFFIVYYVNNATEEAVVETFIATDCLYDSRVEQKVLYFGFFEHSSDL